MRVLIVEDDAALGTYLQRGLRFEGHDVALVADGQTGLDHALEHTPDLMVLDLGLPQKDGIQVLEEMHGRFAGTSVLVLTGRSGLQERVDCLNMGADDFLMKPFSLSELMARCRALLRRRGQFADPTLKLGGVELNRMERRVSRAGVAVELTTKEFALLEYLMQGRGRTCSRTELLREVWQMTPDAGTNVVDVYVNYLRKKLGGSEAIATVRGEGYAMGTVGEKKPAQSVKATVAAGPVMWGVAHA